ncbi:MAG: Pr6Pr family membrane protein [Flavitalea sp.]
MIRFFSFFTIQNNLLVTLFATARFFNTRSNPTGYISSASVQTALTMYIVIVGIVYNAILRSLWAPAGWQLVADNLLHTVIPILMLIYWIFWVDTRKLHFSNIPAWIIYPFCYLIYSLIRGYFVNWYPYPFLEINKLGIMPVLINSGLLLLMLIVISVIFVFTGRQKWRWF